MFFSPFLIPVSPYVDHDFIIGTLSHASSVMFFGSNEALFWFVLLGNLAKKLDLTYITESTELMTCRGKPPSFYLPSNSKLCTPM